MIDKKLIGKKNPEDGAIPPQDFKVFARVIRSFIQAKNKSNSG